MKTIILSILLFTACSKEEDQVCKTCDENVNYQTLGVSQYYIQSSTTYCNGEWVELDGKITKSNGTNPSGWWKKTVTIKCHD